MLKVAACGVGAVVAISMLALLTAAVPERDDRDRVSNRPVVLVWGETDTITPLSQGIHLEQLLAHGSLVVLPRAGHGPFLKEPELFGDALNLAISHIRPAAGL